MKLHKVERLVFFLSVVTLSCFYGIVASHLGWFPAKHVYRAMEQLQQLISPPGFVSARIYEWSGVRTHRPERIAQGLTLVASVWKDQDGWTPGLRLLDAEGKLHHRWRAHPDSIFEKGSRERPNLGQADLDIQGSYLFPNGDVLINLEYVGTVRLDACSRVQWRLLNGGHHSIARADDGTFWIPSVSERPRRGSPDHPNGLPGLDRPVYHEYLQRVTSKGEVRDRIHVLDLLYENGLERHIRKSSASAPDVTHLNDIEALPVRMVDEYPLFEAGDLLVSLRNLHLVMVVDPDTEEVKWHASQPFLRQHDPDFTGEGWVGVFDNNVDGTERGTMLGGSRVIALQPHTGFRKILFSLARAGPFYTSVRGKWQKLDNGNLLLVESEAGRVVEVTADGRLVWEWIVEPYDAEHVPYVTDAIRVDLRRQEVRSWPCSPADSVD